MAERAEATSSSASSLARWVILLALGGAIALPYTSRTAGQPPAADASRESDAAASSSSASSRSDDETAHTDAVALLGEFVGINASESGLLNAAARDAASIVAMRPPAATIEEARAALIDLKNSAETVTGENVSAVLAAIIAARRPREVPPPAPPSLPGSPAPRASADQKATAARVAEFLNRDSEQLRVEQVVRAFAERKIAAEFLVATVPDPIDSNARWTFDAFVDSIERAAAASSFVLDRFYIPDWDRDRDNTSAHVSAPRRTHEQWPAVVLFRDANFGADTATRRLLVTSLVSETATSGIHHVAFTRAIGIGELWRAAVVKLQGTAAAIDTPVRVMGPSFSGSIPSMRNAIRTLDPMPAEIRIVSGAATAVQYPDIEQDANPHVTFHTTVIPDGIVLDRTMRFLKDTDPLVDREHGMAVLHEANTTYGNSLLSRLRASGPLDHARKLPFPLHISRLRGAADAESRRAAAAPAAPPRFLSLRLDDPGAPTDQIPSLSPATTASQVELVLANILDAIDRQRISTVGLLATDTRDKLFLAEQIARSGASARLFTVEGDLFYVHPDYNRYVLGMIVASSYPLFSELQARFGSRTQVQFPSTNTEGVYNAMIALLDYDERGRRSSRHSALAAPSPLDYTFKSSTGLLYPQVWISVVGVAALWPLRAYDPDRIEHLQAFEPPPRQPTRQSVWSRIGRAIAAFVTDTAVVPGASPWTRFGLLALAIAGVLHAVAYLRRRQLAETHAGQWVFFRFFGTVRTYERAPYVVVALAALSIACTLPAIVLVPMIRHTQQWVFLLTAAVTLTLTAVLWYCTAHAAVAARKRLRRLWRRPSARLNTWAVASVLLIVLLGVAVGVVAVVDIVRYFIVLGRCCDWVLYYDRAAHPGSGVSPVMPGQFLLAAVYVWAAVHLWRLTRVRSAQMARALETFRPVASDDFAGAAQELTTFISRPAMHLRPEVAIVAMLIAVTVAAVVMLNPLSAPEPDAFSNAFKAGWILVQVLLCLALAEALTFWIWMRKTIGPLTRTPLLHAFGRLSPSLLRDRLSPRAPTPADLYRSARFGQQLGHKLAQMIGGHRGPVARRTMEDAFVTQSTELRQLANALEACRPPLAEDMRSHRLWTATHSWRTIRAAAHGTAEAVERFWTVQVRASLLSETEFDNDVAHIDDDVQRWFLRAEEFVAMQGVLVVRELLARLANVFFYVIVGVLLMVAAQGSFPFQPKQHLLATAWAYVVIAVVLIFTVFVQMERDPLISAMASTDAGKVRWDATVWSKVILYGVIPLATIFAAQFPHIGGTILDWLSPVQRALP